MTTPIVVRGVLGWGNRKSGLEAYGPGGRWDNTDPGGGAHPRANPDGDLLGDALGRAGAHEGADLLVIAVDRFGDTSVLDRIAELITDPEGTSHCTLAESATGALAAEVAALRAQDRTLRLTMRTVRDIAADRAEKVAEIARLLDVAELRALTEDTPGTPTDSPEHGELLAKAETVEEDLGRAPWDSQVVTCNARDVIADLSAALRATTSTPPVCATCNGSRLKPWKLLTDSELASALRTICHRTGASIPCPDCTEDTHHAE